MTFRERIFLSLSTQPEYRWYCYSILFLCGCTGSWWNLLYRPWLRQLGDLRQELHIMQRCRAARNAHQSTDDTSCCAQLCVDLSHLVVQKVTDAGMTLISLQKKETTLSGGQACVSFELMATGGCRQVIALCNYLASLPAFLMILLDIQLIESNLLRLACTFLTVQDSSVCDVPALSLSRNLFKTTPVVPPAPPKSVIVTAQLYCDIPKKVCFVLDGSTILVQEQP